MDPNETLRQIIYAATHNEPENLAASAEALVAWLQRGGFAPNFRDTFPHGIAAGPDPAIDWYERTN